MKERVTERKRERARDLVGGGVGGGQACVISTGTVCAVPDRRDMAAAALTKDQTPEQPNQ